MQCIQAGIKSWEIDDLKMADCIVQIWGYERLDKEKWRRVSLVCYNIAAGYSDPKTFPKSIKKYMPELWGDDEEVIDPLIEAARARKQKLNGR